MKNIFKKIILIIILFLFSFSLSWGEEEDGDLVIATSNLNIITENIIEVDLNSARIAGRVLNDNEVIGWLVFSWKEENLTCLNFSQNKNKLILYNHEDYFYSNLNNLSKNRVYYFKACGKDSRGNIISGKTKNFITKKGNTKFKLTIQEAEIFLGNSVKFKGHITLGEFQEAYVYFVFWAFYENFNQETDILKLKKDSYFEATKELEDNTKYYYHAVVENKRKKIIGISNLESFTTGEKLKQNKIVNNIKRTDTSTTKKQESLITKNFIYDSKYWRIIGFIIFIIFIFIILFLTIKILNANKKSIISIKELKEKEENKYK